MADVAVAAKAVSKDYPARGRRVRALRDVSFSLARGETVALMGDNGAGKSTLLDVVCGLTEPSSGSMTVLGRRPRASVLAGDVAAMLQTGGLLPDITVAETVQLVASCFGRSSAVESALETAGVADIAHRRIGVCSGGEQQRVKFALALIPDASLLVLDEPTAGMDWHARAEFWDRMADLTRSGRTLLYATHYADEVQDIADRILVLASGRLVADTSVDGVARATRQRQVLGTLAPDAGATAALSARPGVRSVELEGGRLTMLVDADQVNAAVALLLDRHDVRDLRVVDPPFFSSLDALIRRDGGDR